MNRLCRKDYAYLKLVLVKTLHGRKCPVIGRNVLVDSEWSVGQAVGKRGSGFGGLLEGSSGCGKV